MADINKIVIPKVMNQWQELAEGFRYDDEIIDKIKAQRSNNPQECCREFFRDWLRFDHCEGPKTWLKLLEIIEEYTLIAKDIKEKIREEVLQLKC